MTCTHDDISREMAVLADGMCPLCLRAEVAAQAKSIEAYLNSEDTKSYTIASLTQERDRLAKNDSDRSGLLAIKDKEIAALREQLRWRDPGERPEHDCNLIMRWGHLMESGLYVEGQWWVRRGGGTKLANTPDGWLPIPPLPTEQKP